MRPIIPTLALFFFHIPRSNHHAGNANKLQRFAGNRALGQEAIDQRSAQKKGLARERFEIGDLHQPVHEDVAHLAVGVEVVWRPLPVLRLVAAALHKLLHILPLRHGLGQQRVALGHIVQAQRQLHVNAAAARSLLKQLCARGNIRVGELVKGEELSTVKKQQMPSPTIDIPDC